MKKIFKSLLLTSFVLSLVGCNSANDDVVVIATDTTYRPFEWVDDSGELVGIDMDIIRAIAIDQEIEIEIRSLGFDAACTALETGEADVVIAGMTINDDRCLKYDFSTPYYETGVSMAVKSDSDISSYEDLEGKTVVAKTSTVGYEYAYSIKDIYGFKLEVVEESSFMFEKVESNEAVALFEDTPVLKYEILVGERDLIIPLDSQNPSYYGIAVLKGANDDLLEKINTGLENIISNGIYDEILEKYE